VFIGVLNASTVRCNFKTNGACWLCRFGPFPFSFRLLAINLPNCRARRQECFPHISANARDVYRVSRGSTWRGLILNSPCVSSPKLYSQSRHAIP
jgi:hypothetical protein